MLLRLGVLDAYHTAMGFLYAADMGAHVINASFNHTYFEGTLSKAVKEVANDSNDGRGITIVNGTIRLAFETNIYKAASTVLAVQDEVVGVSSTDKSHARVGGEKGVLLDLVAPGVEIFTTTTADRGLYELLGVGGNSFAIPIVSGVVGLMLSKNPHLTRQQIYDILTGTADEIGPPGTYTGGFSEWFGYGRVNAAKALAAVPAGAGGTGEPVVPWDPYKYMVVPTDFELMYVRGDHHLNHVGIWIAEDVLADDPARVEWSTDVRFADKNFDDNYWWELDFGVLAMEDGIALSGESPWRESGGDLSSAAESALSPELLDLEAATVILKGWEFDFNSSDHHIDVIGIRLTNVEYDPGAGTVSWTAEAEYQDKNHDDAFRWRYQWEVVGLAEGAVLSVSRSGTDSGNTLVEPSTETQASLAGFENAVVLPQGWRFDFASKDHEIRTLRFGVRNFDYDPSEGAVSWAPVLNYSDRKPSDDYGWRYDLGAIAFNGGSFATWWGGPQWDDGGTGSGNHTMRIR
jgi:hypothetical protein